MGVERKRPTVDALLSEIDQQLGVPGPVTVDEVRGLTNAVYFNRYLFDAEQQQLTELKDTVVDIVILKSDKQIFPGSENLLGKFNELRNLDKEGRSMKSKKAKERIRAQVNADYIRLRDETLSHVLSANPYSLPVELRQSVIDVRTKYDVLKKGVDKKVDLEQNNQ